MDDQTVREGGCGCGHVRFRLRGEPIFVNNCHCRQCQQQTGSTSVVNAFYEMDRVALLHGELTTHMLVAGSGGPHQIVRCARCGVAVWSHYPRFGHLGAGVRVGTLDDAASLRPDAVIFAAEKMPWVGVPDDVPVFDGPYNPAELLPPHRYARIEALVALSAQQKTE